MYKYKRNGFTLVELMAVIIIISLITLLTFPNIINQIKKTKKSNNKMIEDVVIEQAKKYVSDNKDDYNKDTYIISVKELINNDYIKEGIVKADNDHIENKYVRYSDNNYYITDKGYIQIKYLESTGTQYIDTMYKPNNNTSIDIKYKSFSSGTSPFAVRWSLTPTYDTFGVYFRTADNKFQLYYGRYSKSKYVIIDVELTDDDIDFKFDNSKIRVNNVETMISMDDFMSDYTLYLYCWNVTGEPSLCAQNRIYYMKIYDNNELVRDYIPVLDYNGVACLYDKVEGKFYYNQGTGEFLYG